MSSMWGNNIKISVYGESHGSGIGVVIDGFPAGMKIDRDRIRAFMSRRAPGRTPWSTKRREADVPEMISGVFEGRTTGTPIHAMIRNTDTRSGDYANLRQNPRPGHADYTGWLRYGGFNDPRGGGHFSGRLTAPIAFAGALCLQWLEEQGIRVYAHAARIGGVSDDTVDPVHPDEDALRRVADKSLPVLSDKAGEQMAARVEQARMGYRLGRRHRGMCGTGLSGRSRRPAVRRNGSAPGRHAVFRSGGKGRGIRRWISGGGSHRIGQQRPADHGSGHHPDPHQPWRRHGRRHIQWHAAGLPDGPSSRRRPYPGSRTPWTWKSARMPS